MYRAIFVLALLVAPPGFAADEDAPEKLTADVERVEADEIELDTTTIKGNRALPKVLAIVPWKKALPPELAGQPETSLLESVLQPLERDVFQRELRYLSNAADQNETDSADKDSALSSDKRARPEE